MTPRTLFRIRDVTEALETDSLEHLAAVPTTVVVERVQGLQGQEGPKGDTGDVTPEALQALADAQAAQLAAENAQAGAETAEAGAQLAETNAGIQAAGAAGSALASAGSADAAAQSAQDALVAQGAAEDARDASVDAQGLSEAARDAAQGYASNASGSAGAAASAKDAAPSARDAASGSAADAAASEQAAAGYAASIDNLTVGSTTTGAPGTDASVQDVGTPGHPILSFTVPRGDPGQDGIDAAELEMRNSGTAIEWRHVGDVTWTALVTIAAITGQDGSDGREVQLQKSATHVQWRYVGDVTWTNLVALTDITGPPGPQPPLGSATPLMDGVAAAGDSTSAARDNHRHPIDTSRAAATEITDRNAATLEPMGIATKAAVTITFVDATRVVTVAPTSGSYDVWFKGVKTAVTATKTVTLPATSGLHYVYFDEATLTLKTSMTAWDISATVQVCAIQYDTSQSLGVLMDERHGVVMDWASHLYNHVTRGTQVVSGFAASNYALGNAADASTTPDIATGVIADEDLETTIAALAAGAGAYKVWHRAGAAGDWTWTANAFPFTNAAAGYIHYNQLTGGSWTRTELAANRYVNMYAFALPSLTTGFGLAWVMGQAVFTTVAAANAETVNNLAYGTFPFSEAAALYKLTFLTANGNANTGKVQLISLTRIIGASATISQTGINDHAALSGLTAADVHPAASIGVDASTYGDAGEGLKTTDTTVQAALDDINARMATLDTAQTIAGTKDFNLGALKLGGSTVSSLFAPITPWAGIVTPPILFGGANAALAANQCRYYRVTNSATVSKVAIYVGTSSGNISVGLYANTGTGSAARPGSRIATSGAVACPSSGAAEVSLGGSYALAAGDWVALSCDNGTATFASNANTTFLFDLGRAFQGSQSTAHPCPATATMSTTQVSNVILIGATA